MGDTSDLDPLNSELFDVNADLVHAIMELVSDGIWDWNANTGFVYRNPGWAGTITGFRIGFDNPSAAHVAIKSFHTAPDTRHNINNSNFIRGYRSLPVQIMN